MKTILIKSGWQTVNIGDIGHVPGILALLASRFPHDRLIMWMSDDSMGVGKMLRHYFPNVTFVKGEYGEGGNFSTNDLKSAFESADMLIQGSGPTLHAETLRAWVNYSDKPFGVFGITLTDSELNGINDKDSELTKILNRASFIFTRETASLKSLSESKVVSPKMGFAPDACLGSTIRQDDVADRFLEENQLIEGKYICVIPRLRKTPYYWSRWETPWCEPGDMPTFHTRVKTTQEQIKNIEELNHEHRAEDMAKLRGVVVDWIRKTGLKVLLCPEMSYQLTLLGGDLYAPLPDDVKEKVVIKDRYWLTDEAAGVYKKAMAVISQDCHSPLIAYTQNTPAFYLRQSGDTQKGQMYSDFGLSKWILEMDDISSDDISARLMEIYNEPTEAERYLNSGMGKITKQHKKALDIVADELMKTRENQECI